VTIVESIDPLGPFGAKEGSEGGLHAFPPALTNAIADASGLRLTALPATPDRVFDALQARRRERKLAAVRRARQEA
jgi:4-hydroxybenzoyl-CoA reductase subunit alpha